MFDLLKTLLEDLKLRGARAKPDLSDERVATAALLIHTIAVDGRVLPNEKSALRQSLSRNFDMTAEEADQLIETARRRAEEEADFFGFTSVLKRSLDGPGRAHVIELMWEIAFSDGVIHEFEDNVVWRVADLLEVPQAERMALRAKFAGGGDS
ncbi:tellurite resistance TerB family protein [Oryzibacter oryziterrae]|uniref:tellurite resistance TerB family protein n=1 Tax=Oryzibacter oryziterrae TaxID=2766474 RepID=UPI001F3F55F6|nr:TerB family tellurite resistance protein [Oryzibacter oryziterrae]